MQENEQKSKISYFEQTTGLEPLTKFHIREIYPEFSKILDADVAELYGVENKRINEAVSNKPEKFPNGYIWKLSDNKNDTLIQQPENP